MARIENISVVLVEANEKIREMLRQWISSSSECHCALTCANASEALLEIPRRQPHVALVNVHLRGESGITCTERLRQRLPQLQIIALSEDKDQDLAFEALKSGACGYLLLDRLTPSDVLRAITEAHFGGAPIAGQVARRLVDMFRNSSALGTELSDLSPREMDVLRLLSAGMSNKQIAAQLSITYDTACVHLRRIYGKLRVRSRTEAILKYIQSQRIPRATQTPAARPEAPLDRLEHLLSENVRLAAELERNSREIVQLRAAELEASHKPRGGARRAKTVLEPFPADSTVPGETVYPTAFPAAVGQA